MTLIITETVMTLIITSVNTIMTTRTTVIE